MSVIYIQLGNIFISRVYMCLPGVPYLVTYTGGAVVNFQLVWILLLEILYPTRRGYSILEYHKEDIASY